MTSMNNDGPECVIEPIIGNCIYCWMCHRAPLTASCGCGYAHCPSCGYTFSKEVIESRMAYEQAWRDVRHTPLVPRATNKNKQVGDVLRRLYLQGLKLNKPEEGV
jgi:hypothetical protein